MLSSLQPIPYPYSIVVIPTSVQPMPYPYCIVTMPTTYALLWLHCCHAYNLSYALPLLQSYHAYNLCPTLTSLLPCLLPMPYPYCIVVMPTTCPMPYPYCIVTMPTTYDLPFVHCYHAYNLWLSLFALLPCLQPVTYPLPSMFIPEKDTFSTAFPVLSSSHVLPKLSYPYTSLQASPCVIEKAAINICQ